MCLPDCEDCGSRFPRYCSIPGNPSILSEFAELWLSRKTAAVRGNGVARLRELNGHDGLNGLDGHRGKHVMTLDHRITRL